MVNKKVPDHFPSLDHLMHELRSPLSGIQSLLSLFDETSSNLTAEQRTWLRVIEEFTYHLKTLTTNVLFFEKMERNSYTVQDELITLSELLQDLALLKSFACKAHDLTLDLELSPDLPLVRADCTLLRQALLNLLDNAIKFTPAQGRIILSAHLADQGVMLCVSDTGQGIAKQDLERVRKPYTQIHQGEGLGLGLWLVDRYVAALGMAFSLESEPSHGTKAILSVPASYCVGPCKRSDSLVS